MRLTDEQIEQRIQSLNKMSGYGDYLEAPTELLSARKVVEAARKLVADVDPVLLVSGCRTGASTVWDEHIEGIRAALASHGGEQKRSGKD